MDVPRLRMSRSELDEFGAFIRAARAFYGLSELERWRRSPNGEFLGGDPCDILCRCYPMFLDRDLSLRENYKALRGWHEAIWREVGGQNQCHWHSLAATIDRLTHLLLLMQGVH